MLEKIDPKKKRGTTKAQTTRKKDKSSHGQANSIENMKQVDKETHRNNSEDKGTTPEDTEKKETHRG